MIWPHLWFCRVLLFMHADRGCALAPGLPCALCCERVGNSRSNLARSCGEIAKLCLPMTLFEIGSVGWAKGALAPCPPSIGSLILGWWARFRLRSSSFALRASADGSSYGGRFCPPYASCCWIEPLTRPASLALRRATSPREERGEVTRNASRGPRLARNNGLRDFITSLLEN